MNFSLTVMSRRGLVILMFFVAGLNACTKLDATRIGTELIPGVDLLHTDTLLLPVETFTLLDGDTNYLFKTDEHVLGYLNDPLMGTTEAAVFMQPGITNAGFTFPNKRDSLFLDSAVLSISYVRTYGDTSLPIKLNVYRVTDPTFVASRLYKTFESPVYNTSNLIGSVVVTPSVFSKWQYLAYRNDSVRNQIRIPLSNAFAQELLNQDSSGVFRSDSSFKTFLNGIAIVPDASAGGNSINYLSLNDPATRINLYYRVQKNGLIDTTLSVFPFNALISANANKITRNYSLGEAGAAINGSVSPFVYIQSVPGTMGQVRIPGLDTASNRIVHRAELVARQVFAGPLATEQIFRVPQLHAYAVTDSGRNQLLPFDSINYAIPTFQGSLAYNLNLAYLNGLPNFVTDASGNRVGEYRLTITRFVQNVLNGNSKNRSLRIAASYLASYAPNLYGVTPINPIAFGRVRLGGGSHPQYRMFVRIYYSK
ncbi:MAG: DUF4270 family protein [Chitinophagaceae bacterium]